jgi:Ca2+-binding RTX toxin-like protein
VHINSELPQGTFRGTDHDPLLATFFIEAPNEAPVANADSYAILRNGTLQLDGPGLLANDTDIDGDALSASLVSGPLNGTLTLNADGSLTYTANKGYIGTDSFTYRASDGEGASSTATVRIAVQPQPTAVGDGVRAETSGVEAGEDLRARYNDVDGTMIDGAGGNDTLRGGSYDDVLIGGTGDDQMFGGKGADEFRFFGDGIEGGADRDRLYDLSFDQGDVIRFEGYGAGTFGDAAYVDATDDGTGALISGWRGLVEAARSDDVTAFRQGAGNNNLVVRVTNAEGQVQEIVITGGWSEFLTAGGEAMM